MTSSKFHAETNYRQDVMIQWVQAAEKILKRILFGIHEAFLMNSKQSSGIKYT